MTGSRADREHRKWIESAVRLDNNPYSQLNITARQIGRSCSFLDNNRPELEERQADCHTVTYCGLRAVNADRYNRDYFINNQSQDDRLPSRDLSFTPEEVIDYDRVREC